MFQFRFFWVFDLLNKNFHSGNINRFKLAFGLFFITQLIIFFFIPVTLCGADELDNYSVYSEDEYRCFPLRVRSPDCGDPPSRIDLKDITHKAIVIWEQLNKEVHSDEKPWKMTPAGFLQNVGVATVKVIAKAETRRLKKMLRINKTIQNFETRLSKCQFDDAEFSFIGTERLMLRYCRSEGQSFRNAEVYKECYDRWNIRALVSGSRPYLDKRNKILSKLKLSRRSLARDLLTFEKIKKMGHDLTKKRLYWKGEKEKYNKELIKARRLVGQQKDLYAACQSIWKISAFEEFAIMKNCEKFVGRNSPELKSILNQKVGNLERKINDLISKAEKELNSCNLVQYKTNLHQAKALISKLWRYEEKGCYQPLSAKDFKLKITKIENRLPKSKCISRSLTGTWNWTATCVYSKGKKKGKKILFKGSFSIREEPDQEGIWGAFGSAHPGNIKNAILTRNRISFDRVLSKKRKQKWDGRLEGEILKGTLNDSYHPKIYLKKKCDFNAHR